MELNMNGFANNPLAKHFRQPSLYIKLPSQGRWYPDGTLDIPVTGEVPIYPMTAKDEITMKTPDALLNGASTAHVIASCCPSIRDPWKMPAVDLDPVLIAIRIATYGKEMDFSAVCPHCGTELEKGLDLDHMMSRITPGDWDKTIHHNGLEIILKPQCYEDFNKNNMSNFEQQRIMQLVQDQEISDEDKSKKYDELFQRLIETGISQVSKSIAGIRLDDGSVVTDEKFIKEFLDNCEKSVWDLIKNRLDEIKKENNWNELTLTCGNEECQKEFTTPFVFEQTNFFG